LYMLLPLWPGETDASHMAEYNAPPTQVNVPTTQVNMENRLYLLVYYVPFSADEGKDGKKKSKNSGGTVDPYYRVERSVYLPAFKVLGRLVGYDELRGTGVRLPADGLSVTGPMSEAQEHMPSSSLLLKQNETDWVIATCDSREKGVQLLTDALARLGLCFPLTRPPMDERRLIEGELMEEEEVAKLTPIGRAAMEMVWAGAMALTSFGH